MLHRHPFLSLVTLAYLAFVGWVTLTPGDAAPTSSELVLRVLARLQRYEQLDWLTYDRAERLANVGLFVPVGLFLVLLFGSRLWWLALAVGIALTSAIETAQREIPGRVPDGTDVVNNTLGTVVGIVLCLVLTFPSTLRRWVAEDESRERRRHPANAR
ncbi:VanZ family protein [Nocardioides anomalus]|uniref:VanZ family protein n=1 Tax=Nocardioides anomalus TaxID=2712223 RepID=A0A6G6WBB0_9ACTN|nr:VanZ family protein [Nocardioides anomalus]QIG42499.1 VanZ family protein [Nocardioides anomalus]